MKYMLDFPGGYNYGFPRNIEKTYWVEFQDDRNLFKDYLGNLGVPAHKRDEAYDWARWYTKDEE